MLAPLYKTKQVKRKVAFTDLNQGFLQSSSSHGGHRLGEGAVQCPAYKFPIQQLSFHQLLSARWSLQAPSGLFYPTSLCISVLLCFLPFKLQCLCSVAPYHIVDKFPHLNLVIAPEIPEKCLF